MKNQSLFQLVEMLRKGLFFYIGVEGVLVNYIHVDDVVEALLLCGKDNRALGHTYNLSQTSEIEQMVAAFSAGLGIERKPLRLPEWPIRQLAHTFGWLPGFPLTVSRVDALTGRCRYESWKIRKELDFEFKSTLDSQFVQLASSLDL